jgi:hypothetical protein
MQTEEIISTKAYDESMLGASNSVCHSSKIIRGPDEASSNHHQCLEEMQKIFKEWNRFPLSYLHLAIKQLQQVIQSKV